MEVNEVVTNVKGIEADFMKDLTNANSPEGVAAIQPGLDVPGKPPIIISKTVAKLFCDVKNGLMARILSKDYDEDIKAIIRAELSTTDKEIELYKGILEELGGQYIPEEHQAMVTKILGSPLILAIETEYDKIGSMLQKVKKAESLKTKTLKEE